MNRFKEFSYAEVVERAKAARLKAIDGDPETIANAEALSAEERRRASLATTITAPLEEHPRSRERWWWFR